MHSSGWSEVQRGVFLDSDLETSPLEIRTDSSLGSDEKVEVAFYTSVLEWVVSIKIFFTSIPQFQLSVCTEIENFPTNLPSETVKDWKITLTRTPVIRLVIHCNEVEVLNFVPSDSTCNNNQWNTHWKQDVGKMSFFQVDTASDYYKGKDLVIQSKVVVREAGGRGVATQKKPKKNSPKFEIHCSLRFFFRYFFGIFRFFVVLFRFFRSLTRNPSHSKIMSTMRS